MNMFRRELFYFTYREKNERVREVLYVIKIIISIKITLLNLQKLFLRIFHGWNSI